MIAIVDWDVYPDEVDVVVNREIEIPDDIDEEDISDYLSDTYGYCHKGYVLEK